jgi:hypothetical protein
MAAVAKRTVAVNKASCILKSTFAGIGFLVRVKGKDCQRCCLYAMQGGTSYERPVEFHAHDCDGWLWIDDTELRFRTIFSAKDDAVQHFWVHLDPKALGTDPKGFAEWTLWSGIDCKASKPMFPPARAKSDC